MRNASEFGLPNGDAVLSDGVLRIVPRGQSVDHDSKIAPAPMPQLAPMAQSQSITQGSHFDRAKAFRYVTAPMSALFAAFSALVALVGFGVPIFSISLLLVFFLALLAWWLIAWIFYNVLSADGAAVLQIVLGYRLIRHEQRDRIGRYKRD